MDVPDTRTIADLFEPFQVGPLTLPNRIVMAPLTRSRAAAGNVPTQLHALYYSQRASAGLIISEATQIAPEGQGYISTPESSSDEARGFPSGVPVAVPTSRLSCERAGKAPIFSPGRESFGEGRL